MLGKTAQGGNLEGKGRSRILFAERKESVGSWECWLPLQGMLPQDACSSWNEVLGDWRPAREIGYPSLGRHRDHHLSLSGIGWSTLWEVWGAQSREIWGRADGDAQG